MPVLSLSKGPRTAALAVAVVMLFACGGSGSVEPTKTLVTYQLVSIDGVSLPITDSTLAGGTITAGDLILVGTDSARSHQTDVSPPVNGNPSATAIEVEIYGVQRNGSTLVLEPFGGSPIDTAFVNGNTITLNRHVPFVAKVRVYDYVTQ